MAVYHFAIWKKDHVSDVSPKSAFTAAIIAALDGVEASTVLVTAGANAKFEVILIKG